ncbi:MAG: ABC transporter permease subunit [Clostridia bacterium]|nr:ABC transporter permease subunit [Clostridia bacterium]
MKKILRTAGPAIFWIAVWEAASLIAGSAILLPGPADVVKKLVMVREITFWRTVGMSLLRTLEAYLIGVISGGLLAVLCGMSKTADALIRPALRAVRATPVVSFIILALVWIGSSGVPVLAGALMVVPVVFSSTREGISSTDPLLLEMAKVFSFGPVKTWTRVILPSAAAAFTAACETCVGLCFKATVAAEVIGIPKNAVGTNLYSSKIYLETDSLLAWTFVVILMSLGLEKVMKLTAKKVREHEHYT